ncbi:MAG: hypothetical protein ABI632_12850 [Pseudolysinimonas sp.]
MSQRSLLAASAAFALILGLVGCTTTTADDTSASDDSGSSSAEDTSEAPATTNAVPTLTDAPAAGGPSMALSATSIDPGALTISVGEVVTFTSGDGSIHGLVINGLDSVSVASSLEEYYQFTEAGTYEVSDELSTATATITVQ